MCLSCALPRVHLRAGHRERSSAVPSSANDGWEQHGRPHFLTRAAFEGWRRRALAAPAGALWGWLHRLVTCWRRR